MAYAYFSEEMPTRLQNFKDID